MLLLPAPDYAVEIQPEQVYLHEIPDRMRSLRQ